jgi:hypothetical protein
VSPRFVSSVQSSSVKGCSRTPRPKMMAEIDDVMTTRFTAASRAALSTRSVPSRAGRTNSSSFFGSVTGTGDATCRTYCAPPVAWLQPASELRSASTNSISDVFEPMLLMLARTALTFALLRTVLRTRQPLFSSSAIQYPAT